MSEGNEQLWVNNLNPFDFNLLHSNHLVFPMLTTCTFYITTRVNFLQSQLVNWKISDSHVVIGTQHIAVVIGTQHIAVVIGTQHIAVVIGTQHIAVVIGTQHIAVVIGTQHIAVINGQSTTCPIR